MTLGLSRAMKIAVIIVTFNSAAVIADCLDSIAENSDAIMLTDVIVADNASSDETLRIVGEPKRNGVRVVALHRNAGFAAGINAGVKALGANPPDAVLVLNPDCRLTPGSLGVLTETLAASGPGIAAPRLVNLDGSLQPTLRRHPTVRGALAEAVLGGRLASRLGVGELVFESAPHSRAVEAAWVTGAALLIRWDVLTAVGPWDESYLLYSEETDFIYRAADLGWSVRFEPAAEIVHRGGESRTNPTLAALLAVNKVKFFRSRHGRVASTGYYLATLLGESVRAVTGREIARASLTALTHPSRRMTSLGEPA
jgi:GT2 family glycosyltransferase